MLERGKGYKFVLKGKGKTNFSIYHGEILDIDGDLIEIRDKFGHTRGFNKNEIMSYVEEDLDIQKEVDTNASKE